MELLNIGCGTRFHPSWTNVDQVSTCPSVQACDIRKGLPFPDNYFDACYSSHVLEHLLPRDAHHLIAECFRVLKPQGVIRVVVPDLHDIAARYLTSFEQAVDGVSRAEADYDWMVIELYDQAVRHESTGQMGPYLAQESIPNRDFVQSRLGNVWSQESVVDTSVWKKLRSRGLLWLTNRFRLTLARLAVSLIAGHNARQALEEGLFRCTSGEVHRWMYDRFSLARLLQECGFIESLYCQPDQSRIPDFNSYELDRVDGQTRIPQSLFMEAMKP